MKRYITLFMALTLVPPTANGEDNLSDYLTKRLGDISWLVIAKWENNGEDDLPSVSRVTDNEAIDRFLLILSKAPQSSPLHPTTLPRFTSYGIIVRGTTGRSIMLTIDGGGLRSPIDGGRVLTSQPHELPEGLRHSAVEIEPLLELIAEQCFSE